MASNTRYNNTDGRGVVRGKCSECSCPEFVKQDSSFDCARSNCNHKPVKHKNLSTTSQSSTSNTVPAQQYSSTPTSQYSYHQQQPRHQQQQSYANVVSSSGYGDSSYPSYHYPYTNMTFSSYNLPNECSAEGCNKPVFYDHYLGPFKYCSPTCRDNTVLEEYDRQLKREVEMFGLFGDTKHEQQLPHPHEKSHERSHERSHQGSHDMSLPQMSQKPPAHVTVPERSLIKETHREVTIKMKPNEESGFIFCKDEDKVVICGAKSPEAIELLKKGTVYLYDIISKIRDFRNTDLEFKEVCEVEELVKDKSEVKFIVARHSTIQIELSTFFKEATWHFDKIVLVKYVPGKDYGVKVESFDKKLVIKKDSTAYYSGLKSKEELKYYAAANNEDVLEVVDTFKSFDKEVNSNFGQYKDNKLHLILAACY